MNELYEHKYRVAHWQHNSEKVIIFITNNIDDVISKLANNNEYILEINFNGMWTAITYEDVFIDKDYSFKVFNNKNLSDNKIFINFKEAFMYFDELESDKKSLSIVKDYEGHYKTLLKCGYDEEISIPGTTLKHKFNEDVNNILNKNPYYCGNDGKDLFDRFEEGLLSNEEFIGFMKGNVIKYITRYQDKNGIEDLNKAKHYIERLIQFEEKSVLENEKLFEDLENELKKSFVVPNIMLENYGSDMQSLDKKEKIDTIYIGDNILKFGKGKFDDWCVYLNGKTVIDEDCFKELQNLKYDDMYKDFVSIYDKTTNEIEKHVVLLIEAISPNKDVNLLFAILYMCMIAEENKKNTKLGKRIKRYGVYKILIDNQTPEYAANFMKGLKWTDIDNMCKGVGF